MLSALYIENLAVIEKAEINFTDGLTVFTGETGAGKSIVIDAINACLGHRISREIVRTGAQKASVIACCRGIPDETRRLLEDNGFPADEEELLLQRDIYADGRSSARIGGRPATATLLREVGLGLITIHGQHDNQALLLPDRHLHIIDNYGELGSMLEEYQQEFNVLRSILKKLKAVSGDQSMRRKRAELLQYEIAEIERAKLSPRLEEILQEKSRVFRSSEKIAGALSKASAALFGGDEIPGALDQLSDASAALTELSAFREFQALAEELESLRIELNELARSVSDSLSSLEYDQSEADAVEKKLKQLSHLKSRYGADVAGIIAYCEKAKEELSGLTSSEEETARLNKEALAQKNKVAAMARDLTGARLDAAMQLSRKVEAEARFLEMPNLRVEVSFAPCKISFNGDHVAELLLSANPGEPPKPIARIASGGELSRIMLAIKSALADKDDIGTLIFDEIDTGVSGKAAQKIGLKLKEIGRTRQILCVTHSAQIAALADNHLLIRKDVSDGRTRTVVLPLDESGRIEEVARIFSTDRVTDLMRQTAASMIEEGRKV
ncbi:MAG: DNA repair protein RecN [Oscillospiraceae bacterium]|nr:DNA repair protein RecN [Oscillospiraceae bacterium]